MQRLLYLQDNARNKSQPTPRTVTRLRGCEVAASANRHGATPWYPFPFHVGTVGMLCTSPFRTRIPLGFCCLLAIIGAELDVSTVTASARAAAQSPVLSLSPGARSLRPLPSQWADYFGTHYAKSPEEARKWCSTIRSYGGAHMGLYVTAKSQRHKGPFTGREVRVGLADFHARINPSRKTAEQLIPELIKHRLTGIYVMTGIVRPSLEPFDKDLAYWTVYQIHKRFPSAWRHVVWQMGNEVVGGHFDPQGLKDKNDGRRVPLDGLLDGYDLQWKEEYYVEHYLAPAIEAVQRASQDVYDDPHKIKILLGSMNPYNRPNIEFVKNVFQRKFTGKHAPTLKGDPVWKHIDVFTVHYMFGAERAAQRMQHYADTYLKTGKVDGIWITEEYGRKGQGPVTMIQRGFRFLSWVAHNRLDADQARLVWWGEGEEKPGGSAQKLAILLGRYLARRSLYFLDQKHAAGRVYLISDGKGRQLRHLVIALVPHQDARFQAGELRLALPGIPPDSMWRVVAFQYSADHPHERTFPEVKRRGNALQIRIEHSAREPMLLFVRRESETQK